MIKKSIHLKLRIITAGLTLIFIMLSACSEPLSKENKNENEINISQEKDTTQQYISSTPSKKTTPDASTTLKPDNSMISSVTEDPQIATIESGGIKETTEKKQSTIYAIHHEKDNSTYKIIALYDKENGYTLQLVDEKSTLLQVIELGWDPVITRTEFEDVNLDGYTDIVLNTGGTINETHDLYIWDTSSKNLIKVIYEGFDMLVWFTVHEGYIENFIRGGSPEESIKEKLIWKGNTLIKESE
ncbi:hypothetical protein ABFV83_12400 [Lacrimispora sp. BS-2]|uniref:Uncharacterized protein n=1 Tax=Lacrimispora sp. BS-2 TaxID=3151850 RepID=A0AAU7PK68_9FIRM